MIFMEYIEELGTRYIASLCIEVVIINKDWLTWVSNLIRAFDSTAISTDTQKTWMYPSRSTRTTKHLVRSNCSQYDLIHSYTYYIYHSQRRTLVLVEPKTLADNGTAPSRIEKTECNKDDHVTSKTGENIWTAGERKDPHGMWISRN